MEIGNKYFLYKRFFDIIGTILAVVFLVVPMLIIAALIKLTSKGPVIYLSKRMGINNSVFQMAKYRTMRTNTPQVATHLLENPDQYVTPIGRFLRKYSLDELPQLINILRGELSFVGPRPALFNQDDLTELRTQKGVHMVKPGLTGWAQINGRDDLPIKEKVNFDEYYLKRRSFWFDIRIIFITIIKVIKGEGVQH